MTKKPTQREMKEKVGHHVPEVPVKCCGTCNGFLRSIFSGNRCTKGGFATKCSAVCNKWSKY